LPEPANSAFLSALTTLGRAMHDDGTFVSDQPELLVTSGYTYFGQVIDHDLTHNRTNLRDSSTVSPEETVNNVTSRLDLDTLYGKGPQGGDSKLFTDGVRFKIGPLSQSGRSFDVGIDANGPAVADDRTLENVIVRQMIAFFARLHNFAVKQFEGSIKDPEKLFARARQKTVWQYQWLVYNDYLHRILHPPIYDRIFNQRKPTVTWDVFSIPIEFAVAGMRFGHSMVRENYLMSFGNDKELVDILKRSLQLGTLESEWEIEWGRYFQGASNVPAMAMTSRPIDARVVDSLFQVPSPTFRLFSMPSRPGAAFAAPDPTQQAMELPVVTLLRGAGMLIGSGQSAAKFFGEKPLSQTELTCRVGTTELTDAGMVLREQNLTGPSDPGTPLWYYLLKESEVRNNGNRLGPVGSWIVGETIYASLLHDPGSFIHQRQSQPQPPMWALPGGDRQLTSLRQLFALAETI
jgi:Animal haem peroxidase